jgi:hypothetical protein
MLELNKNDGGVCTFENHMQLCTHLMAMENEKLLGCDLYLMLEKDLPHSGVPPKQTPAVIKSNDKTHTLVVSTKGGIKQIPDPTQIGIELEVLDALFEEYLSEGKVFLAWDSRLLEAIKTKGGHNRFAGDHIKNPWNFLILDANRIAVLLNTLRKPYDHIMLQEAWEKDQTVIDICKGNFQDLQQIVIQSGDQIEDLRQDWCHDYCAAHGFSLTQTEE